MARMRLRQHPDHPHAGPHRKLLPIPLRRGCAARMNLSSFFSPLLLFTFTLRFYDQPKLNHVPGRARSQAARQRPARERRGATLHSFCQPMKALLQ